MIKFTWTKFLILLAVVFIICVLQGFKKRENFADIYGEVQDDKVPKVPKNSLWAKVANEAGFKPTAAVSRKEITPENCRIFSRAFQATDERNPEADDQLGTARMECLMKYGEFAPETSKGVDQYEPDVDQAFYTGHPMPI
jgi:hypothetical protein